MMKSTLDRFLTIDQPLSSLLDAARPFLQNQEKTAAVAAALIQKCAALLSADECQDAVAIIRMIGYYGLPNLETVLLLFDLALNFDKAAIPVIEHMPALCDKSSVEIAMTKFQSLLQDDRSRLVPVLASVAMLPLTPSLQITARKMTLQALEIVSISDMPAVCRALLLAGTTKSLIIDVIAAIRQQTSSIHTDVVFPLVQVVSQHCRSSTRTVKLFLSAFAGDSQLSPFDMFLILSLLMVRRYRASTLDVLRQRISNSNTADRLLNLFRTCPDTCQSLANSFVCLGHLLLHSPPVSKLTTSLAGRILRQSFQSFPGARLEIARFLLSSLASSCDIQSTRAASRTLLDLAVFCPVEIDAFNHHVIEALYHTPYFSSEVLHFLSLVIASLVSFNPTLISNCLVVCQKNILSENDDQKRVGYILSSHLVKSGKLNDSDRDDIMIWAIRADSQRPNSDLSSMWFLDFLVHTVDTLTEDEVEHILNVHLYPQFRLILKENGQPITSDGFSLTSSSLLIQSIAALCSRVSSPIPITDFLKEYSDPTLHLLSLAMIMENQPTSDFALSAIPFCLELFDVINKDSTESPFRHGVPLTISTCTEGLVSQKLSLSPRQQLELLYRIYTIQTFPEALYFKPFVQSNSITSFMPASCTKTIATSTVNISKWIVSQLTAWHSSEPLRFCLGLKILLILLERSDRDATVGQLFNRDVSTPSVRKETLLHAYSFFLRLFELCSESCSFFTVLSILQKLARIVSKSHELGSTCFKLAKTILLKHSDDPKLSGFVNPVSITVLAPESFLSGSSRIFLENRRHLLNLPSKMKSGDSSRDFVFLTWAALAFDHYSEVFPFVLHASKCILEFTADDESVRHRGFSSLTRHSLPVIIDLLQRICLLGIHRVSLSDRSRSDFCQLKEYLSAFLLILKHHDYSNPKTTQTNCIRLFSDLHYVFESCIKLASSKQSDIPKKSLAPLSSLLVSIVAETRAFTNSLRLERNNSKKLTSARLLPSLLKRVEQFESRLSVLVGPFQFQLNPFDIEECLEQFSDWRRESRHKCIEDPYENENNDEPSGVKDLDLESDLNMPNGDELNDEEFIARFYQESGDESTEVAGDPKSDQESTENQDEIDCSGSSDSEQSFSQDSDSPIRRSQRRRNTR